MGLRKGQTNNPNGRPKLGTEVVTKVRNDPRVLKVWSKLFEVAMSLNTETEHKDAVTCSKIIADKTIPTLKAQEIEMSEETLQSLGVIVLPSKKPVGSPVSSKNNGKSNKKSDQ